MEEIADLFLTTAEIVTLTGSVQPATQEQILIDMGLKPHRNRANRVMLAREALIRWQLGHKPEKATREPKLRMLGA